MPFPTIVVMYDSINATDCQPLFFGLRISILCRDALASLAFHPCRVWTPPVMKAKPRR